MLATEPTTESAFLLFFFFTALKTYKASENVLLYSSLKYVKQYEGRVPLAGSIEVRAIKEIENKAIVIFHWC